MKRLQLFPLSCAATRRDSIRNLASLSTNARPRRQQQQQQQRPQQQQQQHNDLTSFLAHARRVSLDSTSTTYIGTKYEYIAQRALTRLGFDLIRTGGRQDHGIDLLGTWKLPEGQKLRILGQCKAVSKKLSPSVVRELEGTFAFAGAAFARAAASAAASTAASTAAAAAETHALTKASDALGFVDEEADEGIAPIMAILISSHNATPGVREALGRSRYPMGFMKLGLSSSSSSSSSCARHRAPSPSLGSYGQSTPSSTSDLDSNTKVDTDSTGQTMVNDGIHDDACTTDNGGRGSASRSITNDSSASKEDEEDRGRILQFIWNKAAADAGLIGMNVTLGFPSFSASRSSSASSSSSSSPSASPSLEPTASRVPTTTTTTQHDHGRHREGTDREGEVQAEGEVVLVLHNGQTWPNTT